MMSIDRYNLGHINLESRNIDLRKECSVGAVRLFAIFLANHLQDCHGMPLYIQKLKRISGRFKVFQGSIGFN